jgi:hypothetical protein
MASRMSRRCGFWLSRKDFWCWSEALLGVCMITSLLMIIILWERRSKKSNEQTQKINKPGNGKKNLIFFNHLGHFKISTCGKLNSITSPLMFVAILKNGPKNDFLLTFLLICADI